MPSPTSLAILVPVLGRPHRVAPLVESAAAATPRARLVFLCTPGDDEQIAAVEDAGQEPTVVDWPAGRGDYARKMNHGFVAATERWVFLGADDLSFHLGWFEACLDVARKGICVVGTNDLGNARVVAGHHSTHTLVRRDYLECGTADEDGVILCELYDHQFVDDEFVRTARARGTFVSATRAIVEHLHPDWGKGAEDATYRKARAGFAGDRRLFESRRHLWERRNAW